MTRSLFVSAARLVLRTALAWLACTAVAAAQEWFPRFDLELQGEYATTSDPRVNWMFDFAADLDAWRTDGLRAVFVAEYEAVAGEQFRRFDVNQGNYLLEGALLFDVAGLEAGLVWHHVSRHLSDRTKRFPVDWNMIALRFQGAREQDKLRTVWRADARATVTNANIDYRWELELDGRAVYTLTPRYGVVAGSTVRVLGVDGSRDRGAQTGVRFEAGMRMTGTAAAAELFVGGERRIDPYPVGFGTGSWFLAGLRLTTR